MGQQGTRNARRLTAQLSAILMGATALAWSAATPAQAAVQATYYVSSSGTGSACTQASPCSLSEAQSTVEANTSTMTGDLDVELEGGTYPLSSALAFTAADSGQNGYNVVYEAVPGENVVLSGGTAISGWTLHDSSTNIYEASVPAGFDTRQLWVDGARADIASEAAGTVFGTMTKTSTGFTFTNTGPNSWTNAGEVDVVYANSSVRYGGWESGVCGVASITSGTLTEQDPCYTNATETSPSNLGVQVSTPTACAGRILCRWLDLRLHRRHDQWSCSCL